MSRRYEVAAFSPNGERTGDTGRRFRTRRAAVREQRRYDQMSRHAVRVPVMVDGKPDWTRTVRLVTYRVVEVTS